MRYSDEYSSKLKKKFSKIKNKDISLFRTVVSKMEEILENPNKRYKFLKNKMKGFNRIHIGSFVLIFVINHKEKTVYFEDFEHHDNIYE